MLRTVGAQFVFSLVVVVSAASLRAQAPAPASTTPQHIATLDGGAVLIGSVPMPAGVRVTAPVSADPPRRSARREAPSSLPGPSPALARSAEAAVDPGPSNVPATDIAMPLDNSNTELLIKRDTLLNGAPAGYTSAVADPSVGSNGQAIFETFNWYAARSTDNGANWSYIDPETNFPATGAFAGGFCCNQRVTQDPARDLIIWSLQYLKTDSTATGTNGIRIAVAHGPADIASNTWQVHDFTPASFGSAYAQGHWLDFPGLAVSSNYLYFSYNIFTTTTDAWAATVIGRVPLDNLASNTPYTLVTFVTTSPLHFTLSPVSGATTRMFFGAVSTSNSITVVEWPEASTTPTLHTVGGLNTSYFFPAFPRPTCLAFDGSDPCMNADSRMQTGWVTSSELGFMWGSSQNAAAGRPYPFVRAVIVNPNSPTTILSQPDLFNSKFAYVYPAVSLNARGHVGGVIDALGGSQGTGIASTLTAIVRDDYSAGAWATMFVATSNAGTPGRWGHYNGSTPHDVYPNTWLIGGKTQSGGQANENSRIHNAWLMRGRDEPFPFTDDPIIVGVTLVKAVHVTELRARIDSARVARGLSPYSWSTTITAGTTITAAHILELREALRQSYVAASATPPTYTDPSLAAGMMIRAVHITELRSATLAAP